VSQAPPVSAARVRDPGRGLRMIGAASLVIEAIVLGLALVTIHALHPTTSGDALAAVGVLTGLAVLTAAIQRLRIGPGAGLVVQLAVVAAGLLIWPLFILGAIFGGLWVFYLRMLRSVR
jgi:hypothetical protein